jgi:hypothetical protein
MFSDVPRISSVTKNMTIPINSSVIYNTTTSAYEYFDGVAWVPFTNFKATGEPTGFPLGSNGQIDTTRSTLSFNNSTRTFSISPTVDYFYFYHSGREFKKTVAETIVIDDVEGLHYIYFDENGIIQKSTTFSYDIILKNVFISIIYWDFNNKKYLYIGEERHGCTMDAHTHARIHAESGAVYVSGMNPNFIYSGNSVIDGTGNSASNLSFAVSEGTFRDEDIVLNCLATDFNINIPIYFRINSSVWRRREGLEGLVSYRLIYDTVSNRIQYNKKVNTTFTLETPASGNFVLYHLYAINDAALNQSSPARDNKYILIAGTQEYTSKVEAKYNAINEISEMDNFPFIEAVAIGTIIFEHNTSYTNIAKARLVSIDGENFIDWRKKLNLKPLTALANSHNFHGGLYGKFPYYHSDQPISVSDNVVFNSSTVKMSNINASTNNSSGTLSAVSTTNISTIRFTNQVLIKGFANGTDGKLLLLHNASSSSEVVLEDQTTSNDTASNRIIISGGYNILTVGYDSSVLLQYDLQSQRWRTVGGIAIGGINVYITRKEIDMLNNDVTTLNSLFNEEISATYRVFSATDPLVTCNISYKKNNTGEPNVLIVTNSYKITRVKNTSNRLNIYIENNLLNIQNILGSTNKIIIYREV